jgi:putative peptidoglycan lipid II flippase
MKKTAFIVIIITILSKICGFLREMVLSYFYGASGITDAYLIAVSIPMVVFGFLSTGLSTAFIPIYNEVYQKNGEKEAETFTNNMANIIILFATVVVIAVYLFTDDIVRIFAKSFSGETLNLAVYFTRVSIFGIYGTILYHLY